MTLAARRTEIANLQKVQQKQTAALERARDEIVGLDQAAKLLRASLTRKENEAAAAQRTQQRAEAETAALCAELERSREAAGRVGHSSKVDTGAKGHKSKGSLG